MAIVNRDELALDLDPTGKTITSWVVWKWYKEGGLPHIRVGRRVFFRTETVEKWLAEKEAESVTPQAIEKGKIRAIR